ncbi:hypothetical protein [Bacillus mesophilum]|uniref:DUF4363 domain-containing protein n=1 Tax=Bacillus mesophilum TaxID=1071718 RepID=A0A7V7RK05_9BACI|nr:hypothetical protein [Bacillus mesophilum]KAB2331347.1 hypothetical protein F7732_15975 [Bacillus mesophilum]
MQLFKGGNGQKISNFNSKILIGILIVFVLITLKLFINFLEFKDIKEKIVDGEPKAFEWFLKSVDAQVELVNSLNVETITEEEREIYSSNLSSLRNHVQSMLFLSSVNNDDSMRFDGTWIEFYQLNGRLMLEYDPEKFKLLIKEITDKHEELEAYRTIFKAENLSI